jgi:hypothetical protein
MTTRVHIERLVVDEGVLASGDLARFEMAVSHELGRLRSNQREPREAPSDALQTLARSAAAAIHDRMPRP